ncbi:MAG TPA: M48 family peptidase, partial [Erysipelotrichaceae bacterium]|nr:M48 family peptidase [Erysipelotrichaceae bacterium]
VLLHEYAHLLVPNHSKAFYDIVRKYMPEWKTYSDMLK